MIKKTFVQDDDGHWYCIPYDAQKEFEGGLDNWDMWNDYEWDKCRLNGGVQGVAIYLAEDGD